MERKKAIYPLSGDPIHYGHIEILEGVAKSGFFDEIYLAIGQNPLKKPLFSLEERVDLALRAVKRIGDTGCLIKVVGFNGLLRNYCIKENIGYIIKGVRGANDVDYEIPQADFSGEYGIKTIFLPSSARNRNISSSLVKAVSSEGGLVTAFVPLIVKQALEERLRRVTLVGVTGNMGVGKSTFCRNLEEYAKSIGEEVYHLDFDKLVHRLYTGDDLLARRLRDSIVEIFGSEVIDLDNINRKKMAGIVFGNEDKRKELSRILGVPSMASLEDKLRGLRGIVLFDAAYITEYNMLGLVNNNVILLGCNEDERHRRIFNRDGMSREEVEGRTRAQHSYEEIKSKIKLAIEKEGHGKILEVDSSEKIDFEILYGEVKKFVGSWRHEPSN